MAKKTEGVEPAEDEGVLEEIVETAKEAAEAVAAKIEKAEQELVAWFDEHVRNTVVSQVTNDVNEIHDAMQRIKAVFAKHRA